MNTKSKAVSYISIRNLLLGAWPGFLICMLLSACGPKQQEESTQNGPELIVAGDGDFKDFFNNFSSDPTFQEERIKYPLPYFYYEEYADTMSINQIDMGGWQFVNFAGDSLAKNKKTDAYTIDLDRPDSTTVDYTRRGVDNGIFVTYFFRKEAGRWYLIKIEDRSN